MQSDRLVICVGLDWATGVHVEKGLPTISPDNHPRTASMFACPEPVADRRKMYYDYKGDSLSRGGEGQSAVSVIMRKAQGFLINTELSMGTYYLSSMLRSKSEKYRRRKILNRSNVPPKWKATPSHPNHHPLRRPQVNGTNRCCFPT